MGLTREDVERMKRAKNEAERELNDASYDLTCEKRKGDLGEDITSKEEEVDRTYAKFGRLEDEFYDAVALLKEQGFE